MKILDEKEKVLFLKSFLNKTTSVFFETIATFKYFEKIYDEVKSLIKEIEIGEKTNNIKNFKIDKVLDIYNDEMLELYGVDNTDKLYRDEMLISPRLMSGIYSLSYPIAAVIGYNILNKIIKDSDKERIEYSEKYIMLLKTRDLDMKGVIETFNIDFKKAIKEYLEFINNLYEIYKKGFDNIKNL